MTAVYPFARTFFRFEIGYNEGWNLYNAQRLVEHQQLYPVAAGWQTVNYPILSFALMALLHRFTHEYLFTARIVSLLSFLGCCLLVVAIVRHLSANRSGSRRAAVLAGFLCLAIFCTSGDPYLGVDDPQMLAQFVFLLGFYLYVRLGESYANRGALALAAAVFVVAGSIKHNPLDFPLAVLVDLAFVSWRRVLWFSLCGLACAAFSVALNLHFGGPFFIAQMLTPRIWTFSAMLGTMTNALGPILIPLLGAAAAAWTMRRDPRRRVIALLFVFSFFIGSAFGGGQGVWMNTLFDTMFAAAILLGLVFSDVESRPWPWALNHRTFAALVPGLCFVWMLIPAMVNHLADPVQLLREAAARQRRFAEEAALLRSQPGPELCENLLLCVAADKPYVYDPFNATRLIAFGRLDPEPLLEGLRGRRFGAVELEVHEPDDDTQSQRFPAPVLAAISANYRPALTSPEHIVYLPKVSTAPY